MKLNKKIFVCILCVFIFTILYDDGKPNNLGAVTKDIKKAKTEFCNIRQQNLRQEHDSIAYFEKNSANFTKLNQQRKKCTDMQILVTKLAEKSLQEYWNAKFPEYCKYIYSQFSTNDIDELSHYVNRASFTLSCGIDNNVYKSLDDILYGPYWHEFAEYMLQSAPKLTKKYLRIRTNAEKKYPYIFPESVFYNGTALTIKAEQQAYKNTLFTNAVKTGVEQLRNQSMEPDTAMFDFNRLRNLSNVFTTDLHFMIESIYIPDDACIDLKSPLFASHYSELSKLLDMIITLNVDIRKLKAVYEQDILNIKKHFQELTKQQEISKTEEIKSLEYKLEQLSHQKMR